MKRPLIGVKTLGASGAGMALTLVLLGCQPSTSDNTAATVTPPDAAPKASAMVVTANPHATNAGEAILKAGGSAVDAAVAIEAVLSLVEPQSSGLGGGAFMTYYNAKDRSITIYDGREVAPAATTPELFLQENGEAWGFIESKNSGLSVGVPGVVDMLAMAHREQGVLPWSALFDSAIALAEGGFDVSPRLASFFEKYGKRIIDSGSEDGPKEAERYFYDAAGELRTRLVNADYADTLRQLRENPRALYEGPIAEAIVAAVEHPPRAGSLSADDLKRYQARKLEPLCIEYRGLDVCGPPPPSSWVGVGMMLGILEAAAFPSNDRQADWATFIAAQQLSYADRDYYVADSTMVDVPLEGMLNIDYLIERASLINIEAPGVPTHGNPWAYQAQESAQIFGEDTTVDRTGTSHFVVADSDGNVVSMTASVESIFGSARMAGGMFLNNQLTDFARNPRDESGALLANHPAAGKRPRSSMSPTIAVDAAGNFRLATGSPGGNSILAYTAKTIIGILDWGLSPQEAIELPNVVARGESVRVESARADAAMIEALRDRGFNIRESGGENSGLSIVLRHPDGRLEGGVDSRREGTIGAL